MLVVFTPSFLCAWNQMPWRNLQKIVLLWDFYTYSFDDSTDSQNIWSSDWISLKIILVKVLLYIVLECSSRVELCVKVNKDLGMRERRLYAHQGVPLCAGGLVHFLGGDWLPTQEWLCLHAYIPARSLTYFCLLTVCQPGRWASKCCLLFYPVC